MKKTYEAPQMVVHGTIEKITNASNDSNSQDSILGPRGNVVNTSNGSIDACLTTDDRNCLQ